MSRSCFRLVLACLVLLVVPACGDDPAPVPGGPAPTAGPAGPEVSPAEKVRFALDRLLHGPQPRTGAFRIDKLHLLNLEHARADLTALPEETARVLGDPELIARLARSDVPDRNPWHNVLEVLISLPTDDTDLLLAWTRPTVGIEGDVQLQRRAVRVLEASGHPDTAPLLLDLLRTRTRDVPIATAALGALVEFGTPWRERALAVAYAHGTLALWADSALAIVSPFGSTDPRLQAEVGPTADALAWWMLIGQSSGPAPAAGRGRTQAPAWAPARLMLDPTVWPRDTVVLDAALRAGRVLAPAAVLEAGGYMARGAGGGTGFALPALTADGWEAVKPVRCMLGKAGYTAYAMDCEATAGDGTEVEKAHRRLREFFRGFAAGAQPDPTGVGGALGALFTHGDDQATAIAGRILREARPPGPYKGLLNSVAGGLAIADPALFVQTITALVETGDRDDAAVALTIIRSSRMAELIPATEALHARSGPGEQKALRQVLIWLHTADDIPAPTQAAFAARYAVWVEEAPDAEASGLAPGLFDLGPAGVEAYVRGLRGDRREVYVRGLVHRTGLVPQEVAVALLERLDGTTAPADRHAILVAAYRTAPASAAGALAAARTRLPKKVRSEVDDILESVRHRAER